MTHLTYTLLFSLLLAVAMSLVDHREGRERFYLGIYWFCTALASVVAGAWFMHWVHG
jgi:uncharacterized membrane protein YfcA